MSDVSDDDIRRFRRMTCRFWFKVPRGLRDSECWLWMGHTNKAGYGVIRGFGSEFLAHRLSYVLEHGSIPAGMIVRHTCETRYLPQDITCRRCVNPAHLRAGTPLENSLDKQYRWRHIRGKQRSWSKEFCIEYASKAAALAASEMRKHAGSVKRDRKIVGENESLNCSPEQKPIL